MFEYICSICGAVLERSDNDYHEHHDCPYCGNELERVEYCEICKSPVADSKFKYHLCPKCENKTLLLLKNFLDDLDTIGQVEFLQDYTDGQYWKDRKTWVP